MWVTDVSRTGCRLKTKGNLLFEGNRAVICIEKLSGLQGTVVWSRRGAVGIRFDRPLHEAIHSFLITRPPDAEAANSNGLSDHFGRPLPLWPEARRGR